jgi:hypothetical protein
MGNLYRVVEYGSLLIAACGFGLFGWARRNMPRSIDHWLAGQAEANKKDPLQNRQVMKAISEDRSLVTNISFAMIMLGFVGFVLSAFLAR